ncbi:galactosylceramide sulfotransferase-like [Amphiura filiformis]|uniref:galactosylceramide sulfotransferase-like n=1 Tax=Amphiura filiformis TaxID=82378 RepID=UPI003B21BDE5
MTVKANAARSAPLSAHWPKIALSESYYRRNDTGVKINPCKPKKNIVFLKVHKCGSSTVQNILFRFGEKHDLDFVMPPKGNYLGSLRNTTFNKKYMIELPVEKYNILCHHTRYNEQNIADIMAPDSLYVTILRDPVNMFESIFTYTHYEYIYHIKGNNTITRLNKFLKHPSYFYNTDDAKGYIGHGKNPMLYDFGLENDEKLNGSRIDELIKQLSYKYDLVMISDYFHESLILLKELMCWSLEDIVFFPLNSRTNVTVPSSITSSMRKKIRQWNKGDVKLYDYFNKTFWRKVEEFGRNRMEREVELLKQRNEYLYKLCIEKISDDDENVWHPHDIFVNTFKVKDEMKDDFVCAAIAKSELLYTAHLRTLIMQKYDLIEVTPGLPKLPDFLVQN